MSELSVSIIGISCLFFLGHALRLFFLRTKIPDLLFLILLGYVLGPVLGLLNAEDFGKFGNILTTVALVVILYEAGLELRTKELLKSSIPALGLSFLNFTLIVGLATFGVFYWAQQDLVTSLLVGVGIGSISSAIVIPMVRVLSISRQTRTILSLESAITDVLAVVIFLVILDSIVSNNLTASSILMGLGPDTLKSVLLGMFGGFLWAVCRRRFRQLTDVAFAGEAWALFCFGMIELTGLNGAMAVLALGFMLSNLDLLPEWAKPWCSRRPVGSDQMALIKEVNLLLSTFFFVYLGLLIQLTTLGTIFLALALSLCIFFTRFIAVHLVLRSTRFNKSDAMITSCMGPRGLTCAVLATLPLQKGYAHGAFIQELVFAVIPISILLTSLFVLLAESSRPRNYFLWLFGRYKGH